MINLKKDYKKCKRILREYSATSEDEEDKRRNLLKDLFGKIDEKDKIYRNELKEEYYLG